MRLQREAMGGRSIAVTGAWTRRAEHGTLTTTELADYRVHLVKVATATGPAGGADSSGRCNTT